MINDPVDDPFSGTQFFDALLENETYLEQYHSYYRQLVEEYVFGGKFEQTYERIRSQIDELVKTDPNAMYSYEEYDEGARMLYDTVMLRAESVKGQLEGTIPSTDEGQRADSSGLVNASAIDVAVMGEFNMGGPDAGNGGRGGSPPEQDGRSEEAPGRMEDMPDKPEGIPDMPGNPEGVPGEAGNTPGGPGGMAGGPWNSSNRQQERLFDENTPEAARPSNSLRAAGTCAVCLAVLVLALMIVKKYQRKPVSGKNT